MFNTSDLVATLISSEKSYSSPSKDTSLDSVAQNLLDIRSRQN